jgi:regulator of sigma E protease
MVTVLIFLGILSVLILIHEAGHFFTARAFGVKVLEFGMGFPPRIFSFKRGETVYSLNAIPLGGYVKLMGEEDPTHPQSLAGKGALTRFTILSAGAFMNFILPIILFAFIFMIPQDHFEGRVLIASVSEGSPAQLAGLQSGDLILEVDGHDVYNTQELAYRIKLQLGDESTWTVMRPERLVTGSFGLGSEPGLGQPLTRDTEPYLVSLVPRWKPPAGEGNAGVQIRTIEGQVVSRSEPFWEAIPNGFVRMWEMLVLFKNEVTGWIIGANTPQLAGPVGIAQVTGEVARAGWLPLVELMALLSLNLAILNILPIPALDGGRILFVAIEWVRRGKRISPEREGLVHLVGFAVLISSIVVISYFDIVRIIQGGSLTN